MTWLIVAALLATAVCPLAAALLFNRCLTRIEERTRHDLAQAVRDLVTPPAEGVPSPLAVYTDQAATLLASRVVQQFKTTAAGITSGQVRSESSEALAQATAGSPLLGLLAQMLPKKLKRQLVNSPQFVSQLSMMDNNHHEEPGGGGSIRDRLRQGG